MASTSSRRIDWLISELNVLGGAETYVRVIAPLLRSAGWDLRVITLVRGGQIAAELEAEGVPVISVDVKHKVDLGALFRLSRLWGANRPRLVHTHLYHAGLLGRIVARAHGISPVIVHQQGLELARSPLRSKLDRLTSSLVTRYVVTCQAVGRQLANREGIPASKITVIYNGIDQLESGRQADPAPSPGLTGWQPVDAGQQPSLPDGPPHGALRIACVGRLAPEKRQAILLEALARIKGRGFETHTVFFGDGPLRASLEGLCDRLGLAGRVTFAGARRDVRQLLPGFDLFILPSDWEGLSMALLEAMAAGLPVIATEVGGNPELVVQGETGLLVSPGDPIVLADAILQLISDPDRRERMGVAGKRRVQENFSLEESVKRLDRLYKSYLEAGTLDERR